MKLIDIDQKTGKYKLSAKVLKPKPEGYVERERRPRPERGERRPQGDRRQPRGPRRYDDRDERHNDYHDSMDDREPKDFNDSLDHLTDID